MSVIWHDLECGSYTEDLRLWRALAEEYGGPILDVGAGTGRVTLDLARRGHAITALDVDGELLAELERRAGGLEVDTVLADAREFALERQFALCVVPMQTVQLLGGADGRRRFLEQARTHLKAGGAAAIAISAELEPFDVVNGAPSLLPDVCERDGVVYASHPTAVRADGSGFVLERRRETVHVDGRRTVQQDRIRLDDIDVEQLEDEAAAAGLEPVEVRTVEATRDYVASQVVIVGA